MTFKSLTVMVTFLTLLAFSDGIKCWSASESADPKNTMNPKDNMHIVFKNGVLNVIIENSGLKEVLKEVARQTDLEIYFDGIINEKIMLQFDGLPLESGLKRLLKNQNYSFGYLKKEGIADTPTLDVLKQVFIFKKNKPIIHSHS